MAPPLVIYPILAEVLWQKIKKIFNHRDDSLLLTFSTTGYRQSKPKDEGSDIRQTILVACVVSMLVFLWKDTIIRDDINHDNKLVVW